MTMTKMMKYITIYPVKVKNSQLMEKVDKYIMLIISFCPDKPVLLFKSMTKWEACTRLTLMLILYQSKRKM